MREVDDYLADLSERLDLEEATRVEVLREVRAHLLGAVQERVEAGLPEGEAVRQAIDAFGRPSEVARALNTPPSGSGGIVRVGRLLAAVYLPEGDKRGPRLLMLRASLMASVIALLQPLFFIALPSLAVPLGMMADTVATLQQAFTTLLVVVAATAYWLSNRLAGLSLREVLSLNRWSLAALWLSGLLCVGALLLFLNDPLGTIQVTRFPAIRTGPRFATPLLFGLMFLSLPGFYTLASRRWSQQLAQRRRGGGGQ